MVPSPIIQFDIEIEVDGSITLSTFCYQSTLKRPFKQWFHNRGRVDKDSIFSSLENHPLAKGILLWKTNDLGLDLYEFLKEGNFLEPHWEIKIKQWTTISECRLN